MCIRDRARAEGHELVAEKYAWMMERTAPEEFQQIKHLLKVPSGESLALIAEIISLEMRGMDEYRKTYPYLAAQNRDFRSEADTDVYKRQAQNPRWAVP